MIEITERPIPIELVVNKIKTDSSGCVVTCVGLIRKYSQSKQVLLVEYGLRVNNADLTTAIFYAL